ncbi:hypothetical protein [Streptomyces mirabilis]
MPTREMRTAILRQDYDDGAQLAAEAELVKQYQVRRRQRAGRSTT